MAHLRGISASEKSIRLSFYPLIQMTTAGWQSKVWIIVQILLSTVVGIG